MTAAAQVFVFVVAGLGALFIVWLVRRGSLKERFALIWLAVAAGLVLLALARPLLDDVSRWLGIEGPSLLFTLAILFVLGLILHLSVIMSRTEEKLRDLAEAYALLVNRLEESAQPGPPVRPPDQGEHQP